MNFRELMQKLVDEATVLKSKYIGTEHALLALMKTGGLESKALSTAGADYILLNEYLKNRLNREESSKIIGTTQELKDIMDDVLLQKKRGNKDNTLEELLLINLLVSDTLAKEMLVDTNVNPQQVYMILDYYMTNKLKSSQLTKTPNLSKYGQDLVEKALAKIDGVIGRDKEINRIIQVLTRRTKNNPILIGEPGVGKTAIVEGLAKKIAQNDVPDIMKGMRIIALDMAQMVAGTKYRGDFEKRISDTLKEVTSLENVIIFIDEIHTIVGAGSSEGSLDASNIMKPYLTKGELKIIGATTVDEYRMFIEKEAALERRLQPIQIEEPSVEETIEIIKGIKKYYEKFHRIKITDEIIEEAVKLSDRYLVDRFLPDKAIDVIDEASSNLKVDSFKIPEELKKLQDEYAELNKQKEEAVNIQNYEKAAFIRDKINEVELKIMEFNQKEEESDEIQYTSEITVEKIRSIISEWAKVPVTKLTKEENERYRDLDKNLKGTVIGQDDAVEKVSKAIKRARVGLKDKDSPIGTFIFVGPTGVGKTYLAKQLAEEIFENENSLIRIDMSEYMEKHAVSKLIGSPPGYVGYDEGGQLTEKVRTNPYSVILFDEIEKAHPDIFNILLQILDEGRLSDSQGREVDFTNTIIIMTSNAGASQLSKRNTIGFESEEMKSKRDYEHTKEIVNNALKNLFKPEFLNRIDDIIVFNRLNKENIKEIVKLKLDGLIDRISEMGYEAKYTDKVVEKIAEVGFDDAYGARPLDRAIKTEIEDLIAQKILESGISKNKKISIILRNSKISINELGK
ncbi:ATP-dependent Clp protease ATP-binding subunit [Helcococcus ovis]|uniref:ATP-dependent Clp protease ATP-binding subunit n=1 Tax=Helcococcus ovis TaxID=72026 RepID=A0A4R9C0C8_9FIRM|nr:ATP-dependent Clp protease ATP-binding subunit [Helcococcus ovis]TFF65193.1 ATP-dependent Clp protease ATP-binding subunit [Helcococcus ovis]TFF65750.1 ATP-dependent Clp protease ATP-binding subunit [Helcococcus ovis]TFF68516.1 ATP-dependent Clp protease ATP-binding subunit [Helcococcus ovis]WNZ01426.1 ATP-dependent Clp protease ATP-binding subunit [Helcococcus ovis]